MNESLHVFEAVTTFASPKFLNFAYNSRGAIFFPLLNTSKYPCNHRLHRIFLARPIISRFFSIPALSCVYFSFPKNGSLPSQSISVRDLTEVWASNRKVPLAEWLLSKFDGKPFEWHECTGQFRSAVDSQSILSDDVTLTYLKTLLTGKAYLVIAVFAYSGRIHRDAIRVLEGNLGQPQTVVSAPLENFNSAPPVKMNNSESIINFACVISNLVGVFRLLASEKYLKGTLIMNQILDKIASNYEGILVVRHPN